MNVKIAILNIMFLYGGILSMDNADFKQTLNAQEEIYPMPVFCTLTVKNVEESLNWYNALGFRSIFSLHDLDTKELCFAHLRRYKYQDILLIKGESDKINNGHGIAITFQAWTDIDMLTKKGRENGLCIRIEPHNTLWNTRDVTFEDKDGYNITFTYPTKEMVEKILADDPEKLRRESWQ